MALTTKAEIAEYREIATTVKDKKFNPYLEDAQELDVLQAVGEVFFRWIEDNPTNALAVAVLDPKTYQDDDGNTRRHQGLKKVIGIFAYARYILFGSGTDTGFGYVEKQHQDSRQVSDIGKRNKYKAEQQTATQYLSQVLRYVAENYTDYEPLGYNSGNCRTNTSGIRISKISSD